jgi:heme-degrading monooxygenase HmoA
MATLIVQHRLEDYAKWKKVFDATESALTKSGYTGSEVYQNPQNPGEVFVLMHWPTMDGAKAFAQSEALRSAQARAGVTNKPNVFFVEEVDRKRA